MADRVDGTIKFDFDENYMNVWVVVSSPKNGGRPVSEQMLRDDIQKNGIRFNVDEAVIESIVSGESLDKSMLLAKGVEAVDGVNGSIKYYFDTDNKKEIKADEFGNVDFKDLGVIKNIHEGTVIADIIPPTDGSRGRDVRGVEVRQFVGKPAPVKFGAGVKLSEDGSQMIAAVSGNLRWDKSHFVVDKDLTVSGDIDFSIGNIDFIGDIIIKGNVCEGFTVKADGNVTIFGSVTGANIISGGDVSVKLGILSSEIKLEGNLTADFCENSTITSSGNVTAQNFVGCNVVCDGVLAAKGGKATIVGGKYTCLSNVEANCLGSDTYTRTMITLGNVAILAEERVELTKKEKELTGQLEQLELVCHTLKKQKKAAGSLSPEREEMLSKTVRAKYAHVRGINEIRSRLEEIEAQLQSNNDLCIKVKRNVYPGVTVRINSAQLVVGQKNPGCTIRMNENREIVMSYNQ